MRGNECAALACFTLASACFGTLMACRDHWYAVPYAFCVFLVILVIQQAFERGRKE